MPGRSQYVARHKETGIEVQVTFPNLLEGEKQRGVKDIIEAFAHFLGQLELDGPVYHQPLTTYMAEMLRAVDKAIADLKRQGSFNAMVRIVDLRDKGEGMPFSFSRS
jgi:hypothetical protein